MCTGTPRKTGERGRGLDLGEAVSRETGICLKMTHSMSCVCSGDAANHRRASDLWPNACLHYTNTLSQVPRNICRCVQVRTYTHLPRVSSSRFHLITKCHIAGIRPRTVHHTRAGSQISLCQERTVFVPFSPPYFLTHTVWLPK